MKIVSVNVSAVREFEETRPDGESKSIRTAIFKAPVKGPVLIKRLNLKGDDQADRKHHGGEHKAVYAFGQQHLAHWQDVLGDELPAEPFPDGSAAGVMGPGFFGENLSVDHLDESTLRVGDRLRAGTALLEITQPRVPCFKQGFRAGVRSLPRQFVKYGRTGVYLRVLEEGQVAAGDALTLESESSLTYTLADVFAALYDLDGPARADVLSTVLAAEALSDEWRALIEGKLQRLDA